MKVINLHLELQADLNEEELAILKKHGNMKKSISRDILVPYDMTLHALSYAIQRSFGWLNGHLHNFSLLDNTFNKITEEKFVNWTLMAGIYFRFPSEDWHDIYWDDDYRKNENFRAWQKRKYTGPYKYKGLGEHYICAQKEVDDLREEYEVITTRKLDVNDYRKIEQYQVNLEDASIEEVCLSELGFMINCKELLERLPLRNILVPKGHDRADWNTIKKYIKDSTINRDPIGEYEKFCTTLFPSKKKRHDYLDNLNIDTLPITDELIYSYDYGDGWKVSITMEGIYNTDLTGKWMLNGEEVEQDLIKDLNYVIDKYRPICIKKDGIELVENVGGVHGFCEMLKNIYEVNIFDDEAVENAENVYYWAQSLGWKGKMISPDKTL